MKRNIIIGICAVLVAAIVIVCNLPCHSTKNISSIHINSETVRLESDMSKRLSIETYPEDTDSKNYRLVSENEFVAVCDKNQVSAVNEGETFVYAESKDGKTQSNKVKIIVSNGIFDVAAKIIMVANDGLNKAVSKETGENSKLITAEDKEHLKNVEVSPKKATDITETTIEKVPESFELPILTEENATDTVYVTKSGSKFHLSTCSSAKNSTPVSRSQAVSDGKTPCQKCKP